MSAPLPIRTARPAYRRCVFLRPNARSFSTTMVARANRRDALDASATGLKRARQRLAAKRDDERRIPDDMGLLPGTFIRSPLRPMRDLFPPRSLRDRLWYEWKWSVATFKNWVMLWRFWRSLRKINLHWLPWHRREIKSVAKEKYIDLYRAFARGDTVTISELCSSGVIDHFRNRLAARPRNLRMQWKVDGPLKVSMASNRATPLSFPGADDIGLHQMVLRIRSRQRLELHDGARRPKTENAPQYNPQSGKVTEYLVLQRWVVRGEVKEWKVWGFADEWNVNTIEENAQYERDIAAYQAAQEA